VLVKSCSSYDGVFLSNRRYWSLEDRFGNNTMLYLQSFWKDFFLERKTLALFV
jgi:hypothetical protein